MHADAMERLRAANPVPGAPGIVPVDELIAGWGGAERSAIAPASTRRRPHWRTTGLSIALALVVGSGSAAAALTAFTGHPIPQSPDTVAVVPAAGTTHLSTARAADPDGGDPWAVRIGAAAGGLQCLGVGQIDDGRFGLTGLDGIFREVTPGGSDDCGATPTGTRSTIQVRTFLGTTATRSVTVIYGVRGPGIGSVRVTYVDGVSATLPVGTGGAFVVARRGTLDEQRPVVTMTPTGRSAHGSYETALGTPLPASRAGCGPPGHRSKANCAITRPLVPSEGVR